MRNGWRESPGKNFPVAGSRCSLGGFDGLLLKHKRFEGFFDRSAPPPVLDRFLTVKLEFQTEVRAVRL